MDGEDSFLVAFSSEGELKRMMDIDFHLKNHGVTLTISEWQDVGDAAPAYQLDEVWVHITGVHINWMIGATLEVDMLTYRRKRVILILVSFLNRDLLPLTTDVVFGKVHGA